MKPCIKSIYVVFLLSIASNLSAQSYRFGNEIADFKKRDKISPPPKHAILFVGSSSLRMWKDVSNYFPGYTIINRGFGGATLPEVIHYAGDVIVPYEARQILIYCGENDMTDTAQTPQTVLENTKTLIGLIRSHDVHVNILFMSIKPSPSRHKLWPQMIQANTLLKDYMATLANSSFINIWDTMLNPDGSPKRELFTDDMLHMNAQGYKVWQGIIGPYLMK